MKHMRHLVNGAVYGKKPSIHFPVNDFVHKILQMLHLPVY